MIRTKVDDCSIWHGTAEDYKILFPFYNLDMAYNVMKRVRRKVEKDRTVNVEEDLLKYFKTVYGYIAYELKREDEFYNEESENESNELKMYEDFRKIPFIKTVGFECKDAPEIKMGTELDERLFQKMLQECLRGGKVNEYLDEQEI